jgi:hypothetical protein
MFTGAVVLVWQLKPSPQLSPLLQLPTSVSTCASKTVQEYLFPLYMLCSFILTQKRKKATNKQKKNKQTNKQKNKKTHKNHSHKITQ